MAAISFKSNQFLRISRDIDIYYLNFLSFSLPFSSLLRFVGAANTAAKRSKMQMGGKE
jgi:hypothetical protein